MRWVNPSMATLSPSRMVSSTASARDRKRDIGIRSSVIQAKGYLRGGPRRVKWPCVEIERRAKMFTHRRQLRIEWGDCDPAGIVFYPRYFAMFNHSTELTVEAALGINKQDLFKSPDFGGMPAIETRARFLVPTRYCDDVVIDTSITEVRRTSFRLQHRLLKGDALAVEGFEARVWVV